MNAVARWRHPLKGRHSPRLLTGQALAVSPACVTAWPDAPPPALAQSALAPSLAWGQSRGAQVGQREAWLARGRVGAAPWLLAVRASGVQRDVRLGARLDAQREPQWAVKPRLQSSRSPFAPPSETALSFCVADGSVGALGPSCVRPTYYRLDPPSVTLLSRISLRSAPPEPGRLYRLTIARLRGKLHIGGRWPRC